MQMKQADKALLALLILAFAGFLFVIKDSFTEKIIEVGDKAPDFSITTEDGKTITRSNFGGKLLVLNFWATWCPPCVEELPSLDAFQRQTKSQGVVVLGVSIDKDAKKYKSFLRANRPSFLTALDEEANISTEYGTFKWPETYVIDQSGTVVQKHIGPKDWLDPALLNNIKALL